MPVTGCHHFKQLHRNAPDQGDERTTVFNAIVDYHIHEDWVKPCMASAYRSFQLRGIVLALAELYHMLLS
jgi:hypothetical protein